MRLVPFVVAIALLAGACEGDINYGALRPEPSDPPNGAIVAMIEAESGARFTLFDESGGCLAVDVGHQDLDLQSTVHRQCFPGAQVVAETDTCGWLRESDAAVCDVILPRAFFGVVQDPRIAHVCVGTIGDSEGGAPEVVDARFLDVSDEGFILSVARNDEVPDAHLFTIDGRRFGEPPLDAPSEPIYRMCESLAPWNSD